MKKTFLLMGCLLIILSCNLCNGQFISPTANLDAEIEQPTIGVFVGKTEFKGSFKGYETELPVDFSSIEELITFPVVYDVLDDLFDVSILENLHIFPILGSCHFENIEQVTIVDIQKIQQLNLESISPDDLLELIEAIISYKNVSLNAIDGMFIMGTGPNNITVDTELFFAISSIAQIGLTEGNETPLLALIANEQIPLFYDGNSVAVAKFTDEGNITLKDSNGNDVWSGDSTEKIFLIKDSNISPLQESLFYAFPLSKNENGIAKLSVEPANPEYINMQTLFNEISNTSTGIEQFNLSSFTGYIEQYQELIETASIIVNGGMVLININDPILIDNTEQNFENFGFARGNEYTVTINGGSQPKAEINGNYKLIFLGDHLYTAQAKESENGLSFPILIVILWGIAIALFFIFKYYLKFETNKNLEEKIKKYSFIFHIGALILSFILLDREISFQFGVSALDAIFGAGIPLILLALLLVEAIMWVIGYISFAIPVTLISKQGLKTIGIGKEGKGISKGIGALSIWVFCAIYVKLFVNIIFLFINPSMIIPVG
jgi:hypothetical protein